MLRSLALLAAVLLSAAGPARAAGAQPAHSDDPWARYRPGTLGAIIERERATVLHGARARGEDLALTYATFPTRARVTFLGRTRPLSAAHRRVLAARLGTQRLDSAAALAVYRREVLVREGTGRTARELWLPVQEETWSRARDQFRAGRPVVVLVQWFGALTTDRVPDWVFPIMTVEPAHRSTEPHPGDGR